MQLTFTHRDTWLHRVNPGIKLLLSVALFLIVILTHNLNVMINLLAAGILPLILWTGHPAKRLALYASPFLLIFISSAAGMMMFGQGTTTWFHFGLIHITEESFYRGIHLGFRSLQVASVGLTFALTTLPVSLFYCLMQQWRLPAKYAYSFLAAFRMVPGLIDEFQALRHAQLIRGRKKSPFLLAWYNRLRMYAIPLLAGSIRRAHRTAVAMEAKRFSITGERTYYYTAGYSRYDLIYLLYWGIALALSYWLGAVLPYVSLTDVRF